MQNKTFFAFSILFLLLAELTAFAPVGRGERAIVYFSCLLIASIYFYRAFRKA